MLKLRKLKNRKFYYSYSYYYRCCWCCCCSVPHNERYILRVGTKLSLKLVPQDPTKRHETIASCVAPFTISHFPVAQHVCKHFASVIFPNDQVQPVPEATVKRVAKDVATFSPIVTLEPRRRRFHQPVTLTMPLPPPLPTPTAAAAGPLSDEVDPDNLRLLCSLTGKLGYSFQTWQFDFVFFSVNFQTLRILNQEEWLNPLFLYYFIPG